LNCDIVDAMSTVKESTLSPDGTVAEPPAAADDAGAADDEAGAAADELDDELDELQPAATRATTAAPIATVPRRRTRRSVPSPCRPECGLL
jgi:hypothetical protein